MTFDLIVSMVTMIRPLTFQEPTLEPAIDVPVDLSHILASNTLHHRRSRRVVNRELYRPIPHPWGEGVARKDWEKRCSHDLMYAVVVMYDSLCFVL